jgi:hypothetical protein
MTTLTIRPAVTRFGALQVAITALVTVTALIHLALGVFTNMIVVNQPDRAASMGGATALNVMAALFYLCAAGYVVLNVALYLPALRKLQRLTRAALIVFTSGTVLAYFALAQGHIDAFGLADKACEVLLIALLVVEGRRRVQQ